MEFNSSYKNNIRDLWVEYCKEVDEVIILDPRHVVASRIIGKKVYVVEIDKELSKLHENTIYDDVYDFMENFKPKGKVGLILDFCGSYDRERLTRVTKHFIQKVHFISITESIRGKITATERWLNTKNYIESKSFVITKMLTYKNFSQGALMMCSFAFRKDSMFIKHEHINGFIEYTIQKYQCTKHSNCIVQRYYGFPDFPEEHCIISNDEIIITDIIVVSS